MRAALTWLCLLSIVGCVSPQQQAGNGTVTPRWLSRLVQACETDDASACFELALVFRAGDRVPADPARAARLFNQACNNDLPRACIGLGDLYAMGKGVASNPERAAALYQHACAEGDLVGCVSLGAIFIDRYGDEDRCGAHMVCSTPRVDWVRCAAVPPWGRCWKAAWWLSRT